MNKRRVQWGLTLLLVLSLLCGCGASANTSKGTASMPQESPEAAVEEELMDAVSQERGEQPLRESKLIYRGELELETTEFDRATDSLQDLVSKCGGYVESSELHNYHGNYRFASYRVRVPAERYREFFAGAGELCHLLWKNESTEDVTRAYYDVDGRLKTQETKLLRLQELMSMAESMEDIIAIESAISDTEYEIEALSGELRNYDDLVSYSSVELRIREVSQLSNTQEAATGFGERMGAAFRSGVQSFLNGMENLLVDLAYNWIWLLLAVALVWGLLCFRRKHPGTKKEGAERKLFKKRREKREKDEP